MSRVYNGSSRHSSTRVLAAAEKLLRSRGAHAITARKVAAAVGLTPMAIYRHYRNKDALLEAVVQAGFNRWESHLAKSMSAATAVGRLENALHAYRDFALAEPRYFELMFLAPRRRVPTAPASLAVTSSPSFARVLEAVREAEADGTLMRADPAQLVLMMWATAHGMLGLHFSGRFGFDESAFRSQYNRTMELMLEAVAGG